MKHLQELEGELDHFRKFNVRLTGISTDDIDDLKKVAEEHHLSFPILSDHDFTVCEAYGVPIHEGDEWYADHGKHNDPAYFLIDDKGQVLHLHTLTGPFGRPSADALMQTIKYIQKQSK